MENIKNVIRQTPLIHIWRASYHQFHHIPWTFGNFGREHQRRWKSFHNIHKGRRAFIIGNGPSLNKTDLSHLKNETTFGMNRIYLMFEQTDFRPTYHVVSNPNVIEQFIDDIATLDMPKFLPWTHRMMIPDQSDITLFPVKRNEPFGFAKTPVYGMSEGMTVTYICMQIAYYMGIETVYLIGVDHSFKTKGDPHKLVKSETADPNHFHPNYFGKGIKWQLPDLEGWKSVV